MKYIELIKWFNKGINQKKNAFEKLCFEISNIILSMQDGPVNFNDYLEVLIKYHEVLLLNRSELLFTWFFEKNIDLHGQLTNSLQATIKADIQIRPEVLEGLVELAPHDNFFFYLGFIFFNDYHIDKAITAITKIKEKNSISWGILGQCYLEKNKIPKAIECLEFATYLNDKDIHGLFLLSKCYLSIGDSKMSLYYLSKCWALSPRNPEIASLYSIASIEIDKEEHYKIAKTFIVQSIGNDFPGLLANGIILGIKMGDIGFIDHMIDNIKPSDIKSSEFANSLGEIFTEINREEFIDQKIRLLTQLTAPL